MSNKLQNLQPIKRCLISVSDKQDITQLAKFLQENNVEIISTGGTKKLLQENAINAKDISQFTNFPEIMNGRVKTLHPNVHGGLLGVLNNQDHQKQAAQNNILPIDLLIVNLYPFVETVAKTDDENKIIENIDIGGPAMVRSAAKNFEFKTVITCASQYQELINQLKSNNFQTNLQFRKKLASQAFKSIADYDIAIADFFTKSQENSFQESENENKNSETDQNFAENLKISAKLKQNLRYGENSHQKAALYQLNNSGIVGAQQIQGKELSYNNLNDADAAYNLVSEFSQPTCAIIKHANPCGVATDKNISGAYKKALESDAKSAFGGIVALNSQINAELAQEITKIFFEVIIAASITPEAKEILAQKKNLRVLITDFKKNDNNQLKTISGGFLVQQQDQKTISSTDLKQVGEIEISESEKQQLIFAMNICKHVKSNAITLVKNFQTVGIGMGQTSRIDACQAACQKAQNFAKANGQSENMAQGSFLASDAFLPFADNVEIAAKYGVKAIIATGGSVRDQEVIDAANKNKIAIYFVMTRHFKH